MVNGIELFQKKFRGFEDCYTIIGGAACDILMTNADLSFRATKDIDMILILEDRAKEYIGGKCSGCGALNPIQNVCMAGFKRTKGQR